MHDGTLYTSKPVREWRTEMLWEVEIRPNSTSIDREAERIREQCKRYGVSSVTAIRTGRSFLLEGTLDESTAQRVAATLLTDPVVDEFVVSELPDRGDAANGWRLVNVLPLPGVTDNTAETTRVALSGRGEPITNVSTCRKYWFNGDATNADVSRLAQVLANRHIERVVHGPLPLSTIAVGRDYVFQPVETPICELSDEALTALSAASQLSLSLEEMRTIQAHYRELGREPMDVELETIAQTWSEHCSHKTLGGRVRYRDPDGETLFENMLRETIFAATQTIRANLGDDDWCVSVFKDNAGIVTFDEKQHVCIKVETHNHPSALEPYGGANTGIGGVIRDPLGTGLGGRPVCNTDVFCFARPDFPVEDIPAGTLHPETIAKGVVEGVRDYGNRMGIPTVNGAVFFDDRYLGNPLVYCGNVAMIPIDRCDKAVRPGDRVVTVGGRTGRDGIHGATFSSIELTQESESASGGAVQIGDPIREKMLLDVLIAARDEGLYSAITDCGAGGFSSAVGEMGEDTGAEVWLERAPLKYAGLSYTEIWISESQERMVLAVPPENCDRLVELCAAEGVEATVIGQFTDSGRLVLKYEDNQVADLSMDFLHDGRPPVIRSAEFQPPTVAPFTVPDATSQRELCETSLRRILGSLNVCSKEWIIRQYDHEVQGGSVVKPLVGVAQDGPSDAAVIQPDLESARGLVVSCGMNPRFGDIDPYWMAASAIDEAVRNAICVGADPAKIAILDNFCWGNTEKSDVLGSLVRAALACHDVAVAYSAPFVSGKDSLNNEHSFSTRDGESKTVAIPPSLLITALGQVADVGTCVTMDLKEVGNPIYLVGTTHDEMGGSHLALVHDQLGSVVPRVDLEAAPPIFKAVHAALSAGVVRSCHDCSEGGIAVALSEMAFAGELGIDAELAAMRDTSSVEDDVRRLFSESNTRFLLEVDKSRAEEARSLLGSVPCTQLGVVANHANVIIRGSGGEALIDLPWETLKGDWQRPLDW